MTEPFEDVGKKVSELVSRELSNEASDEELKKEIDALRMGIQSFLNEAKDEKDKAMREDALTLVIQKVSAESGMGICWVAVLLFPDKKDFFLQHLDKIKYGENLFLERLVLFGRSPKDVLWCVDKYKDQPYAAEVIKMAAESEPVAALVNVDKYKDQPYAAEVIENTVRMTAESDTYRWALLWHADRYKDQPYAAEVIKMAAERDSRTALKYADKYKDQPYAAEVIKMAAERDPGTALEYADKYKDQPYAAEVIEKAVRMAAESGPFTWVALEHADKYTDQPYAAEAIETMAERVPWAALEYADKYKDQPYAAEVIEKAARTVPTIVYRYRNVYPFLGNSKRKDTLALYAMIRQIPPYPKDILYLSHYVMNGKMSIEEAGGIVKNSGEFIGKLTELKNIPDAIMGHDVEDKLKELYLKTVWEVNNLHNETEAVRFASVEKLLPEELYYLMTYGEEEIFTSTFNGFFNRLMQRLKTAGQSGYDLLKNVGRNKFRIFVKLCSNYGRLGEFLGTMEEVQKTEVIESFVSDLEKGRDFLAEAVTVADTFASLDDNRLLTQIQAVIKREYGRVQAEKSEDGIKLYGLLAGMFGRRAQMDGKWYAEMAKKYEMEDVSHLGAESLFNRDGSNVQQHFFYSDKDGIASFDHFVGTYKKSAGWAIEEKDTFVIITKQKGAKKVVIYANKPQAEDEGIQDISKELKEKKVERIVAVHRGHSYHASKTIENITPAASIVFMGSCGGYNNISGVLDKSQKAHIIATKGTGTMLVNDPLLLMLNEEILEGNGIEWQEFWCKAEDKLGGQKDFPSYVPPHKNLGVLFLKAYGKLGK